MPKIKFIIFLGITLLALNECTCKATTLKFNASNYKGYINIDVWAIDPKTQKNIGPVPLQLPANSSQTIELRKFFLHRFLFPFDRARMMAILPFDKKAADCLNEISEKSIVTFDLKIKRNGEIKKFACKISNEIESNEDHASDKSPTF